MSYLSAHAAMAALLPIESLDQKWRVNSFAADIAAFRITIWGISFEKNGTAWIATSDGLYRYDGHYWNKFSEESGLPSSFVRSVLVTRAGKVWVGTDNGAGVFDGKTFDSHGSEVQLAGPSVRKIIEDPDGTLWFCSDLWPDASVPGGLTSLKDGRWRVYREGDGLPSNHVWDYFHTSDGRQFAMTMKGLARKRDDRWVLLEKGDEKGPPTSMAESSQTGIVVVVDNQVEAFREAEWEMKASSNNRGSLGISAVAFTRQGEIIIGSNYNDGQALFAERWDGNKLEAISPVLAQEYEAKTIVEAPDGAIWCGGRGLLIRWDRYGGEWTEYSNLPPPKSLDPEGNPIFADSQSAYCFDGQDFERMEIKPDLPGLRDRNGDEWRIGPDGSEVVQSREKFLRRYTQADTGLKHCHLAMLDAQGRICVCGQDIDGRNALSIFSGAEWQMLVPPELQGGHVVQMRPDPQTGMWLLWAGANGSQLSVLQIGTTISKNYPVPPIGRWSNGFFVGPLGKIWLFTTSGLLELNRSDGSWTRVTAFGGNSVRSPGIGGNYVANCVFRGKQTWFVLDGVTGGQSSISLFCNGSWRSFPVEIDAMGLVARTADDSLYFTGKGRLYVIAPESEGPPLPITLPTSGRVTHLIKDTRGDLWLTLSDGKASSVFRYSPDRLPPETQIMEADETAREDGAFHLQIRGIEKFAPYNNPKTFLYSWRFDTGPWTPFQPLPGEEIMTKAGLLPGEHTFQVKSRDEAGDIDPTPAQHRFSVTAIPLWERPWFKTVLLGGITLALFGIYWTHRARVREIERLRTRIASDLHDEIGSSLWSILLISQMLQKHGNVGPEEKRELSEINLIARQSTSAVRDIIWFINPEYNTVGDLILRMKDVAVKLLVGIEYRFEHSQLDLSKKLLLDFRQNIFLMFKEVLTNIVRHSQATSVEISFLDERGSLMLKIQDDGIGFNSEEISSGTGLKNIRRRAGRMRGTLEIISAPGQGTTVLCKITK